MVGPKGIGDRHSKDIYAVNTFDIRQFSRQLSVLVTLSGLILGCWLKTIVQCCEAVLSSRYGIGWDDKVSIISLLDDGITPILWHKVSCVDNIMWLAQVQILVLCLQ